MPPAGQSPQPISIVTANPSPAGAALEKQHAPMRFGSFGPIPENRGSEAMTRAAAASGVVTVVLLGGTDGPIDGAGDGDGDAIDVEAVGLAAGLQAAIMRPRTARPATAPRRRERIERGGFMAQRR